MDSLVGDYKLTVGLLLYIPKSKYTKYELFELGLQLNAVKL